MTHTSVYIKSRYLPSHSNQCDQFIRHTYIRFESQQVMSLVTLQCASSLQPFPNTHIISCNIFKRISTVWIVPTRSNQKRPTSTSLSAARKKSQVSCNFHPKQNPTATGGCHDGKLGHAKSAQKSRDTQTLLLSSRLQCDATSRAISAAPLSQDQ